MEENKELLDDELSKVAGGYQKYDRDSVTPYAVGSEYRYRCTSSKDYYYVQIVKCDYYDDCHTYAYIANTWYIDRIYGTRHDSKQKTIYHGALEGYEKIK